MMVAGHPVPPESAAALAEHDRDHKQPGEARQVYSRRAAVRAAAATEYVGPAGGVMELDALVTRMSRDGHPMAGEVRRAVLGQCPVDIEPCDDPEADRVRMIGSTTCGWYDDGHKVYVSNSATRLRKAVEAEQVRHREAEKPARGREAEKPDRGRDVLTEKPDRGRAVLTEEQVNTCRRRAAAGEQVAALANEYGVNAETLRSAVTGDTWPDAGVPPVPPVRNRTPEQWHRLVTEALDLMDDGETLTGAARRLGVSRRSLAAHIRAEGVTDGLPWRPGPWTLRREAA